MRGHRRADGNGVYLRIGQNIIEFAQELDARVALVDGFKPIGVAVAFFVINVTAVVVIVLVLRATGRFVSLHAATDPILIVLSVIQAAAFQFWRYSNGHKGEE